jgi:hypothetical protein
MPYGHEQRGMYAHAQNDRGTAACVVALKCIPGFYYVQTAIKHVYRGNIVLESGNMEARNIFMYWVGKEYSLVGLLRNLIYMHSNSGNGYTVNLITDQNIQDYVGILPDHFCKLHPAHQADFVRVSVLCDYGGIWLDSDTLVIDTLDPLFDCIERNDGFFILQNNDTLWNGIFGSKKGTPLLVEWKERVISRLQNISNISWNTIGSDILTDIHKYTNMFDGYVIFRGLDNMYPVNWSECKSQFLDMPYAAYAQITRDFQPLVALVNSVYKALEASSVTDILSATTPLNYFIDRSFTNMKLVDYDFIEIGTSNFDTLIQQSDDEIGISVDCVKYYLDCLPDKPNVRKIHIGISDRRATMNVYYIPEDQIRIHGLPDWFRGCNCINNHHPLHIKHGVEHLCEISVVQVIPAHELFYTNRVGKLKFLKIDTEGHDCTILNSLFKYIKYLPRELYPAKIQFESNEHCKPVEVEETISLFSSIGYNVKQRGYDTILEYATD